MKKILIIFFSILFIFLAYESWAYFKSFSRTLPALESSNKTIFIDDNGSYFISKTKSQTVEEWMNENKIILAEHDEIIPDKESKLFSGINLQIKRALKIKIEVDGKLHDTYTLQKNIETAIAENKIILGRLDKVSPEKNLPPSQNLKIIITRINIEEKIISEDIDFLISYKKDPELSWREEKIETPGKKGTREVKYKITYKNGQEVSRLVLEKNIVQKPITQVIVKGTYMKLGKPAKGQGTWYAYKGGLFAASTSIPKGSFAKVTNLANGKSIVVQINDYGPQGKGRIIDLDKVAFEELASLGAGIIGVKVEQILN